MRILRLFRNKKTPKPGKLTKREKEQIYLMNPDLPLTADSDILLGATILPQTYLDRQKKHKKDKEIEKRTKRFTLRKQPKKISSTQDYGSNPHHLEDDDVHAFLEKSGIDPTARGTKKIKRTHKKTNKKRKH